MIGCGCGKLPKLRNSRAPVPKKPDSYELDHTNNPNIANPNINLKRSIPTILILQGQYQQS